VPGDASVGPDSTNPICVGAEEGAEGIADVSECMHVSEGAEGSVETAEEITCVPMHVSEPVDEGTVADVECACEPMHAASVEAITVSACCAKEAEVCV
jgi:hypothetical protein